MYKTKLPCRRPDVSWFLVLLLLILLSNYPDSEANPGWDLRDNNSTKPVPESGTGEMGSIITKENEMTGKFYLAEQYNLYGKEVNFWRTVETTCNSLNYFTDGTCSSEYFIVEGYLKNYKRQPEGILD